MNNNERQLMSANVSAEDLSPHRYSPESFFVEDLRLRRHAPPRHGINEVR